MMRTATTREVISGLDVVEGPTPYQVRAMSYVSLLAHIGESNLPPGGFDTIRRLAVSSGMRPGLKVLHAGCNAGFLACELARRSGADFTAIDISSDMVAAAADRIIAENLGDRVKCLMSDMRDTGFATASFDVVSSGGALAFVDGAAAAIQEWIRVVRPNGIIADVELFYRAPPPSPVLQDVSRIIEVNVPVYDEAHWRGLFGDDRLQSYYWHGDECRWRSDADVRAYVEKMVVWSAGHWSQASQEALYDRLLEAMRTFNENMKYLSYAVFAYQRLPDHTQPLLFV